MPSSVEPLPSEHVQLFQKYIHDNCVVRLREIIEAEDQRAHYAVPIDVSGISALSEETTDQLLCSPKEMLPLLQTALQNVHSSMCDQPKPNVHARVCHLPTFRECHKPNISVLRSTDLGQLLTLVGTVTRTGIVMLREAKREYACRRCKHVFEVSGNVAQRGEFDVPSICPSTGEKRCQSTKFVPVDGGVPDCREYQEIKLQEKVQRLTMGSIPRSMIVILTDDLADAVKPGDDVLVHGVLHRRWNSNLIPGIRAQVELMLVAENIQTSNETKSFLHVTDESRQNFARHWATHSSRKQLTARNLILRSVCPQIYGMYLVKLIVALTLIGGVPHSDPSGSRIRGESHLLMVGDPGTAKSQFLRYAAKVAPRSVLTTGIGTTSAGLTVTAVREPGTGEWMLDAGALVLADGGVCCIDEFDGIKSHDRGAIHEAMEQQTLSVAKAGMVCTLDTRATVIAAVNPKAGRVSTEIGPSNADDFNDENPDRQQAPITVGIASPLLSRFDVILTLLDQRNEEWDKLLSGFILNNYRYHGNEEGGDNIWTTDVLRQYFYLIKTQIHPRLCGDATKILSKYYTAERRKGKRNAARTTVRLLEALVRLTQAHARLMFRETATALDAAFAIAAVESSTATQSIVGGIGALHAAFPDDPEKDFEEYARLLLVKLNLENDGINFYGGPAANDSDDFDPSQFDTI